MSKHIQQIISTDFAALNETVAAELHSEISLIEDIGHYLIAAGGKRMRPLLALLAARACGYQGNEHIRLATVIEFLHTATLLHDDVVDMSEMRRGRPTANVRWDNPSSVLVGDFIYSRAFQLLVSIGNMEVMALMADTTNRISEGEVLQLVNQHNTKATEADYTRVIENKTAILFAAAGKAAAILAGAQTALCEDLYRFGLEVGMAFQLIDDVLDYNGNPDELGKNIGDDLAEGKPTLPLIYTMQHGNAVQRKLITEAIQHGGLDKLDEIIVAVRDCGALAYTRQQAEMRISSALQHLTLLPASCYREGLVQIAESAVQRSK